MRFKYFTKKSIFPSFLVIVCWQKKSLNMIKWNKMVTRVNIKLRYLPFARNNSIKLNKFAIGGGLAHSGTLERNSANVQIPAPPLNYLLIPVPQLS